MQGNAWLFRPALTSVDWTRSTLPCPWRSSVTAADVPGHLMAGSSSYIVTVGSMPDVMERISSDEPEDLRMNPSTSESARPPCLDRTCMSNVQRSGRLRSPPASKVYPCLACSASASQTTGSRLTSALRHDVDRLRASISTLPWPYARRTWYLAPRRLPRDPKAL